MSLTGKQVAVLVDEGYEDLEFWVPLMRLQEGGVKTVIVGTRAGKRVMSKSGALEAVVQVVPGDLPTEQLSAVVVPGGWAPDKLRRDASITRLVGELYDQGKVVAM